MQQKAYQESYSA